MPETVPPGAPGRFVPRATQEMASMFDQVSGRYGLLNRLMTLGQDRAWRAAMWREVPESAGAVLDLCTGDGASLPGLRRPGRLVIGADVSAAMLHHALERFGLGGWAPRLIAADAFALPLRERGLDAITVAFGVRNLRPRVEALREMARALKPGGRLIVLEATAPQSGWFAPVHAFHLRRVVPLAGRLSADPSAYEYLSRSIFEFGSGPEFERDLESAGFGIERRRMFMLGATRLWTARRRAAPDALPRGREPRSGERAPSSDPALQNASNPVAGTREMPQPRSARESEWRWWVGAQLVTSLALFLALAYGFWVYWKLGAALPLAPWQRRGLVLLMLGGLVAFGLRTVVLAARILGPPER